MEIDRLPDSLLNGKFLHCQPVDGRPVVEAQIIPLTPAELELIKTFKMAIVCPARRPCSKCESRIGTNGGDDHCQYWRGDSLGSYQILGPNMDKKSDSGWTEKRQ
jgi:hypothetical protein